MNLAQAHRKARMAVKKKEELIEDEELEGGEINLIPYLDIVTNLMLFLLASVTAGVLLGQIETTLPDKGPPSAAAAGDPKTDPNEQPLKLVVSISASQNKIIVWSISGLEGTLKNPKAEIPRIQWQDAVQRKLVKKNMKPVPVFDTPKLNQVLEEIARRRWQGKKRLSQTYQVVLMADDTIPYGSIIPVMDAIRCKLPPDTVVAKACALPRVVLGKDNKPLTEEKLTTEAGKPGKPCLPKGACADGYACKPPDLDKDGKPQGKATCSVYDSSKMALFHDILFSTGFE